MIFGRYEPAVVTQLMTITRHGSVAYDIGSHFGFMGLVLASRMSSQGKVIAFEPVPANVASLKEVVAVNNLADILTIMPKAVSDTVASSPWCCVNPPTCTSYKKRLRGKKGVLLGDNSGNNIARFFCAYPGIPGS
jgi:tRNA1(Val) A37 N6-methylase TrmN6